MSAETAFSETQAVVEVAAPAAAHGGGEGTGGLIDVTGSMMVLTWSAFLLLSVVLYKVAWKPILKALETRERGIRQALEEAERVRAEAAAADERNRQTLKDAEATAQRIVAEARVAAQEGARAIQAQAEQQARTLVEEAQRDIRAATEEARAVLRRETADLALAIAGKVVGENMDTSRNRTLVASLAREIEA
jgi:F-type H+-transporting ATPase subunit b